MDEAGVENLIDSLLVDFQLPEEKKEAMVTSLYAGHHILILGPPGSGKTALVNRIAKILKDTQKVIGCPVNCSPAHPTCPWCLERMASGEILTGERVLSSDRVKRVQGSPELKPEDLIGDLDPQMAFSFGTHDIRAFSPGKLLRANRGILIIDFIDRTPERVLNAILVALDGDGMTIGGCEERVPLDILVVATGSEKALLSLSLDLMDHFDVIDLDYVSSFEGIVPKGELDKASLDKSLNIVARSRRHEDVKRGISTRGAIKFTELLSSYQRLVSGPGDELIRRASRVSLPHRIEVAPHAETIRRPQEIMDEIVAEALEAKEEEPLVTLSEDDILALVEEIARDDRIRRPLRHGFFDLLLSRVKRFQDTKLSQIYRRVMERREDIYAQMHRVDDLSDELLMDVEEERREAEALKETLSLLERKGVLEYDNRGWSLSRRGLAFLLDKLAPRFWEDVQVVGYGRHRTGKRLSLGEGRAIGIRKYRVGDRYRDISFKDTLLQAIRNRRQTVTREDIMVTQRDVRTKMNLVIVLDLSGTMAQVGKLWYAKEGAIALSLAAAQFRDSVGLVSFSNMADEVLDITDDTYALLDKILDLDLHENAFTNVGYGLLKACSLLERHSRGRAKKHIILVSDGDATAPHPSPERYAIKEAAKAARKGITISCICINEKSANPELMHRISRIGRGRLYMIEKNS